MRFIDEHKDVFGVEPVCRVLTAHGTPIAPSTYYAAKSRPPRGERLLLTGRASMGKTHLTQAAE